MNDAEMVRHLSTEAETARRATRGSGCVRKRRHDKREAALRFYFQQVAAGKNVWWHIGAIHKKAPKLTERVAGEFGVTELKF